MIYYIYCSIDDSIFLQFRNLKHLFVIQSLSLSKTFLHLFLTEYFSLFCVRAIWSCINFGFTGFTLLQHNSLF